MTELKELLHAVVGNFEKSLQTRYQIWKFKTLSKSAEITSSLLPFLLLIFVGAVAFVVLSFGLAYWVGSLLRNTGAGFLIVGGFYVLLCIAVIGFRNMLKVALKNFLLDKITRK